MLVSPASMNAQARNCINTQVLSGPSGLNILSLFEAGKRPEIELGRARPSLHITSSLPHLITKPIQASYLMSQRAEAVIQGSASQADQWPALFPPSNGLGPRIGFLPLPNFLQEAGIYTAFARGLGWELGCREISIEGG